MNKNDTLLLIEINDSLKRSKIVLDAFLKYKTYKNNNLFIQSEVYNKYVRLTSSLIENEKIQPKPFKYIEQNILRLRFLLCSFFRLDEFFYISLLENKIASNMRKVILCEGNYNEASNDIKLLTKYYLSIETRMILEIKKARN